MASLRRTDWMSWILVKDNSNMEVEIKLYNEMKWFAPGEQTDFKVKIEEGSTVSDVLTKLKIPSETQRVVLLNGKRVTDSKTLEADSILVLFPPIHGG